MPGLSGVQMRNARIIASVGHDMGMNKRQIIIGLITAMTESGLVNVNHGDRDSLGLFQQRPSQGWGSPAQVRDPVYASRKFFKTLREFTGDSRHMPMGVAAQKVQRSAFPGRYNDHIPLMRAMWKRIARGADVPLGTSGTGKSAQQAGQTIMRTNPYPPDVLAMASLGTQWTPLGTETQEEPGAAPVSPLGAMTFGELGVRGEQQKNQTGAAGIAASMLPMGQDDFVNLMGGGGRYSVDIGPGRSGAGTRSVHGWRATVIRAAKTALGTPYKWGGNSLRNGVDCSGLVQEAYQRAGIALPRVSADQARFGHRRKISNLVPGDLVAWNNSSRNHGADHIAIYIGHGRIIEAASAGTRVRIRKLSRNEGAFGVHMRRR